MVEKTIRVMVEGGRATPGPPLGPTLSPYKLNIQEVVKAINDATRDFEGLTVPVEIVIDTETKKFQVRVGIPTTTALLMKEAGVKQPTGDPGHQKIGNISFEQAVKIAILKKDSLTAKTLKAAVKTILGSARSIGITVDGKDPREIQKLIDTGAYDEILSKYEEEWSKGGG
ncbi:MAG: 50S ribosomal protein L11 [Desulfurococcus sp.]|nr:50S ribosomal protein L11 [Desulfurococcus sp.]